MKLKLFLAACIACTFFAHAQDVETPVIETDTPLLCPSEDSYGTATITNDETYDSYQWYFKYMFFDEEFDPIEGATGASFTYDWYTYDVSYIKVVATKDGVTYESNEILVDSYAWASLFVATESSEDVVFDPDAQQFLICEDSYMINTVNSPYSVIQWYKNGEAIEGATDVTYTITEPGSYYVVAAPEYCPNVTSTSLTFEVAQNPDCQTAALPDNSLKTIGLTKNPVHDVLSFTVGNNLAVNSVDVYSLSGQKINVTALNADNTQFDISHLATGLYFVKISTAEGSKSIKFLKN
ncbi:T9SS type A sorting domain-containing protein [Flavobacterium rhizosphaerae]|uniref:T9SS type A sorting domain-containing protein n=1 Tax=Flavobacterium rhizosphaerae TaxID=3163298 RepID=A0ABW8Z210_9FLAO